MTNGVRDPELTTATTTSQDGTQIGYRRVGEGPGLVVVHGSASSGHNHIELARLLSEAFTVYVPDRRGRGISGPYRDNSVLRSESEDLEAIFAATGARNVLGVSSGAIIALETALDGPAIDKLVLFEPPMFPDRSKPAAILDRFDQELAEGHLAAAMITAMRGAEMGPPIFNAMPRWLTERLVRMMMRQEMKKGAGEYVSMRDIAPTLHYDFQIVTEVAGQENRYAAVKSDVLLLGGSKSPDYLKAALTLLERVIPKVTRVELPDLDHAASWNQDRGGRPAPVAAEILRFLS